MYIKLSFMEDTVASKNATRTEISLREFPSILAELPPYIKANHFDDTILMVKDASNMHSDTYKRYNYYIDCKHMQLKDVEQAIKKFKEVNTNNLPSFMVEKEKQKKAENNFIIRQLKEILFATRHTYLARAMNLFKSCKPKQVEQTIEPVSAIRNSISS